MSESTGSASKSLCLVGLDIGSTTCHAVIARARLTRNYLTGRMELDSPTVVYQSPVIFTPFHPSVPGEAIGTIDQDQLRSAIRAWVSECGVPREGFAAGGAILTGLAAQSANAAATASMVREEIGEALIAVARDPRLESWLAFQGNCGALSRLHPRRRFLNFDIGGGTTNVALGRDGVVAASACAFIGARHLRFQPGSFTLSGVSPYGVRLLEALKLDRKVGSTLSGREISRIVDLYVSALERVADGGPFELMPESAAPLFDSDPPEALADLPEALAGESVPLITFSGGVGEILYRIARGEPPPPPTAFGDLGVELALGILRSPRLTQDLRQFIPAGMGRATVYGLAMHHVEVSGNTLYLPDPAILPLKDLPIVGDIGPDTTPAALEQCLRLAMAATPGACLRVTSEVAINASAIKRLGEKLAQGLEKVGFPERQPLVLFLRHNAGKTLGNYATAWGKLSHILIVVDEIDCRNTQFASLGAIHEMVIPVSFYGMHSLSSGGNEK